MKEIIRKAEELMKADAVLITAAEYTKEGVMERVQVYFWDETEAAMDIITKDDLVQNYPDAGAYALSNDKLCKVSMFEGAEDMFFRIDGTKEESDQFGTLPTVRFMENVEEICALRG